MSDMRTLQSITHALIADRETICVTYGDLDFMIHLLRRAGAAVGVG